MTTAEEHLQAVMAAQGETAALQQLLAAVKTHAEATAAAIGAAFDNVQGHVTRAIEQMGTTSANISTAVAVGEAHAEESIRIGHGTEAYARIAKEHCDSANVKAPGVLELIEAVAAALEEAKTQSRNAVMALLPGTESAATGTEEIAAALDEAETNINSAIHIR